MSTFGLSLSLFQFLWRFYTVIVNEWTGWTGNMTLRLRLLLHCLSLVFSTSSTTRKITLVSSSSAGSALRRAASALVPYLCSVFAQSLLPFGSFDRRSTYTQFKGFAVNKRRVDLINRIIIARNQLAGD